MTSSELLSFVGFVAGAWALGFAAGWSITVFRAGLNNVS